MYKQQAVEQLREYSRAKERAPFLAAKAQVLKERLENNIGDKRTTLAVLKRVECTMTADSMVIQDVESCLEYLDERERCVLWHFYVRRTYDYIEILNEKLCVERSQIYRLKDKAIQKYAMLSMGDFY
ncbi:MAG: hypothetical protein IJ410_05190 [Oscillospiraceae bacterium]|nr:hypothetical protein [Oscillospiraceae bacterium]